MLATNLEMYCGEDKEFHVAVTLDGAAVNLSGKILIFTAKRYPATEADDAGICQKRSDASGEITVTSASGGLATIFIAAADTDELTDALPLTAFWDLRLIASSKAHTLASGKLKIMQNVTEAIA